MGYAPHLVLRFDYYADGMYYLLPLTPSTTRCPPDQVRTTMLLRKRASSEIEILNRMRSSMSHPLPEAELLIILVFGVSLG